jgi:hypothetical protein
VDDVRADVNARIVPVHERPVHPNLAGSWETHFLTPSVDLIADSSERPEATADAPISSYWSSRQNGQRAVRA